MSIYKNGNKVLGSFNDVTGFIEKDNLKTELANVGRNLKTYTHMNQIGLNTGCTMSDILNALTDYSQLTVNSSYLASSDRPLNSPADELITITRLWHSRITIISTDRNGKMCTGLTSYSGTTVTFSGWKRVLTTNIDDVGKTSINATYPTDMNVAYESINYIVKNGIASINIIIRINSSTSVFDWTTIYSGVPKPLIDLNSNIYPESDSGIGLGFKIDTNGDLKILSKKVISNSDWWTCNFSYPVAE